MTDHGFCRINIYIICIFTKCFLNCSCLIEIIVVGTCSVCIDIINVCRCNASLVDRECHGSCCTLSILGRGCNVKCITGGTISDNLCKDLCSSCLRMLQRFQNYDSSSFTDNESTSVFVKRNRRTICFRCTWKSCHGDKSWNICLTDRWFSASGYHHICISDLNITICLANAVCSCRTCCYNICTFAL